MARTNGTYDTLLILKDAGLVAASAAAQVSSADKILDVGAGLVEGDVLIDITAIEEDGSAAQGTLTLDTNPTGGNSSQGTLTLDVIPADGNTMTIGTTVYRFKDIPAAAEDIQIGSGGTALADTQAIIVKTINGTGTAGVDYFAGTTSPHPLVRMAAFAGNAAVLTAIATGVAGDTIATTETFTPGTDIFDAATLGTTAAGAAGDTMTIGTKVYYFDLNGALDNIDGHIEVGAAAVNTQTNIVNAINLTGTPGTGYADLMTLHPTVGIAAFAANVAILTAKTKGAASDLIATTETFAAGTNVFDATTLGATRAGADADERYDILIQGSSSAIFASGIVDLAAAALGAAASINMSAATGTGRLMLLFRNEFMGTIYRYLRAYTKVAGVHVAAGINYTARVVKR